MFHGRAECGILGTGHRDDRESGHFAFGRAEGIQGVDPVRPEQGQKAGVLRLQSPQRGQGQGQVTAGGHQVGLRLGDPRVDALRSSRRRSLSFMIRTIRPKASGPRPAPATFPRRLPSMSVSIATPLSWSRERIRRLGDHKRPAPVQLRTFAARLRVRRSLTSYAIYIPLTGCQMRSGFSWRIVDGRFIWRRATVR